MLMHQPIINERAPVKKLEYDGTVWSNMLMSPRTWMSRPSSMRIAKGQIDLLRSSAD